MELRPSPIMDFDHLTDDGLRDHLLACSDWLLSHDDAGVRESYRAGRDVLRVRIEHRASRRSAPLAQGKPRVGRVLRTRVTLAPAWTRDAALPMVRSHLAAGGSAVYGDDSLSLRMDGDDVVCAATGRVIGPAVVVELRGLGPLRRVFDDALRLVPNASPSEVTRAIEGVTCDVVTGLRYLAAQGGFGSFDPSRCLTWASSLTPPVHPLVVGVAVLLLAADS